MKIQFPIIILVKIFWDNYLYYGALNLSETPKQMNTYEQVGGASFVLKTIIAVRKSPCYNNVDVVSPIGF